MLVVRWVGAKAVMKAGPLAALMDAHLAVRWASFVDKTWAKKLVDERVVLMVGERVVLKVA